MSGLFGGNSSRVFDIYRPSNEALWNFQGQAGDREASLLEQQATFAEQDAAVTAEQKAREVKYARGEQATGYLSSGVTLSGTPLDVLHDTLVQGQQEIDAITARGAAIGNLYRSRAAIASNESRASIFGSRMNYGVQEAQARMADDRLRNQAIFQGARTLFSTFFG